MKSFRAVLIFLLSCYAYQATQAQSIAEPSLIVEEVECRGNQTTRCDFIRNKLRLQPNSTVDNDDVQSAQLRLSALPNFESVRIYLEKGSEVGKARLIVDVVEASPIVMEWTAGVDYRGSEFEAPSYKASYDTWQESIGGRISHQNLLGRHKIASLSVNGGYIDGNGSYGFEPGSDRQNNSDSYLESQLSYIDPNVLGAERVFMSATARYGYVKGQSKQENSYLDPLTLMATGLVSRFEHDAENYDVAFSIGYRLWSYAYLFGSYRYQNSHSYEEASLYFPTGLVSAAYEHDIHSAAADFGVGWNSEDDAYFPTRGTRASITATYLSLSNSGGVICVSCEKYDWHAAFKQTWSFGGKSAVSLTVGGEPDAPNDELRPVQKSDAGDLGITYAYSLEPLDGGRRGRWYLRLATGPFQLQKDGRIGGQPHQAFVALGLRFESRVLGLIDLYATGGRVWSHLDQ